MSNVLSHDQNLLHGMPEPPEEPDEPEAVGRRPMDPELLVLSRMLRLLDDLPPLARRRVMEYLFDRYSPPATADY